MEQYKDAVRAALDGERTSDDRTGAGTSLETNIQKNWDLSGGNPALVTTKRIPYRWVAEELFWFLDGETNVRPLLEKGVKIWSSDALRHNMDTFLKYNTKYDKGRIDEAKERANDARDIITSGEPSQEKRKAFNNKMGLANDIIDFYNNMILEDDEFAEIAGDLGPIYGAQWRGKNGSNFPDQVSKLEESLQENPMSRRMLVSAWNPSQEDEMALPPCHYAWQVNVKPESQKLDLVWNQRSCDTVLGVPFNIASYAMLGHLLAETHGFEKGKLTGNLSNVHVYLPHEPAAREILERESKKQPTLEIVNKKDSITGYTWDDIELHGYENHGSLKNPTPMYGGLF